LLVIVVLTQDGRVAFDSCVCVITIVLVRRYNTSGIALGRKLAGADAQTLFDGQIGLDVVGLEVWRLLLGVFRISHFGLLI
jgi:hypothetical protein